VGSAAMVLRRQPVGIEASLPAPGSTLPPLARPGEQNTGHLLAQPPEMASVSDGIRSLQKIRVKNGPHCLCKEALSCWPGTTTLSMTKLN